MQLCSKTVAMASNAEAHILTESNSRYATAVMHQGTLGEWDEVTQSLLPPSTSQEGKMHAETCWVMSTMYVSTELCIAVLRQSSVTRNNLCSDVTCHSRCSKSPGVQQHHCAPAGTGCLGRGRPSGGATGGCCGQYPPMSAPSRALSDQG